MVFRELNKWNNIKEKCKFIHTKPDIDYLFFDINGLISDKLHELQTDENLIDQYDITKIADSIIDKIEIKVNILNPNKYVGIFIDGVSPKAKMNLQRQRRIREYYKYSDKCEFNFNQVSVGTEFMAKLSELIKKKIKENKNNSIWKGIEVDFSGPEVEGEAEFKIIELIKQKCSMNYKYNSYEKGCIYSTDSDFYLLLLANHCNFFIYNEFDNRNIPSNKNIFFSIRKFRQTILDLFPDADEKDYNKLINDFICLCFLSENNYLPGIHDVLFNDIIEVYKENYKIIGFMNDNGKKLDEHKLKEYLHLLKDKVNFINKIIYYLDNKIENDSSIKNNTNKMDNDNDNNFIIKFELVDYYSLKRDVFREIQYLCNDPNLISKDIYFKDPKAIKFLKFLCITFNLEYVSGKKQIKITDPDNKRNTHKNYWKFKDFCNQNNLDIHQLKNLSYEKRSNLVSFCKKNEIRFTEITYSVISKKKDHEEDPSTIMKEIQSKINEDDQNGFFLNKKKEYYEKNIPNCNKKELVNQFIEGIKWLLGSYYDKVPSWTWYFKNRYWKNKCNSYGPFISDLCEFEENEDFKFNEDEPLSPFVNLLTILPLESSDLLPESYKKFINSEELKELYPKIDSFPDKISMFKSFSCLPLFDSFSYEEKIKKLNESLTEKEKLRNTFGTMNELPSYNTMIQMNTKDQCDILIDNKNFKEALEKINKILKKNPNSENYCYRANIYLKMRRYKDAMNDCKNAFKDKNCVKANLIYARCNKHRGNLEKAKENIKIGLEKTKRNDYLSLYIPNLENELKIIIELENSIVEVENFMKEKKYKEALQKLEKAMLICDTDLKASFPSCNSVSILKSEELKGIPIQWRLLRAEILIMNNDYNEALNVAEIILKSQGNSNNSEANSLKTKLLYMMGKSNIENTINFLNKAVRSYNKNENAKLLIKKIPELEDRKKEINDNFFKKELYEEAIQKYNDLINEYEEIRLIGTVRVILLRNKSTCLIKLNKYNECIKCINEAIMILKNIVFPNGEPESISEYEYCKQKVLFSELYRKRSESFMKTEMFQEAKNDFEILKTMKLNDDKYDYEDLCKKMEDAILSDKERKNGNDAFKVGDYEKALEYYNESINLYWKNSKPYFNRGLTYMKLFKFKKAVKDFENAFKFNNQYYKAIINISSCYLQILEPNNSIQELEKIHPTKDNPFYEKYIEEYENAKKICNIYNRIGYSNIEEYDRLLQAYVNAGISGYVEFVIIRKKAEILHIKKKYDESIKLYSHALNKLNELLNNITLEYNSDNPYKDLYVSVFEKRADGYMNSGKYINAISDYEILIELSKSDNISIYRRDYEFKLSKAKHYLIMMEEAEKYKMEGTKAYKNKDYKKAIDFYTKAIEKCLNSNPIYYNNRAAAYMMLFKYEKAIDDCKKVIDCDNKNIKAYKRLATCYLQLNKPENAVDILKEGLYSCPGNDELNEKLNIAKILNELKKKNLNLSKTIENYESLYKKYIEYKITGYVEVLLFKEIAIFYQELGKINDCISSISNSIEKLCNLVLGSGSHSAYSYKNSDFSDLFTELFKIRAKNYMKSSHYNKAYKDYSILYFINPYDYEIKRNYDNAKFFKEMFGKESHRSNKSSSSSSSGSGSGSRYSESKNNSSSEFFNNKSSYIEYYKILNLNPDDNPTIKDVKKAYRKLALKYHPDRCKDESIKKENEEKMKELNFAYEYLQKRFNAN